jgi:hypothetical protein
LLVVTALPSQPLLAQTNPNDQDVPTTAVVGGGGAGAAMYIECMWLALDTTATSTQFTYASGTPSVADDDTPSQDQTLADGSTNAGAPCQPTVAQNATNYKRHSIGLKPNPDDNPIERQYEKWVAVESTSIGQIGDVFFKVWEPYVPNPPNGPNCPNPVSFAGDPGTLATSLYCFKYQHHATSDLTPPTAGNPLIKETCANLNGPSYTDMWNQAINTGQLTSAEQTAIITRCGQSEKAIYRVRETISKDQPCGEYRREVTVVNTSGTPFTLVDYFDVLCFVHMQLDFTTINWGTVQNNVASNLSGDMTFLLNDGKPTVRNVGNAEMYFEASYDPMVFLNDPTKSIIHFDLKLRAEWQPSVLNVTVVDPANAGTSYCFVNQPIGSNQNAKLDLSIHPDNAQAGSYSGNFNAIARMSCAGRNVAT